MKMLSNERSSKIKRSSKKLKDLMKEKEKKISISTITSKSIQVLTVKLVTTIKMNCMKNACVNINKDQPKIFIYKKRKMHSLTFIKLNKKI